MATLEQIQALNQDCLAHYNAIQALKNYKASDEMQEFLQNNDLGQLNAKIAVIENSNVAQDIIDLKGRADTLEGRADTIENTLSTKASKDEVTAGDNALMSTINNKVGQAEHNRDLALLNAKDAEQDNKIDALNENINTMVNG